MKKKPPLTPNEKFIKQTCKKLDINPDMIQHVMLTNGHEFIGEMMFLEVVENDEVPNELVFINPVRVIKEIIFDESGDYSYNNFLVDWNPLSNDAIIQINPATVISPCAPNQETLMEYCKFLQREYYQIFERKPKKTPKVKKVINKVSNIIDFSKYKNKEKVKG